MPKNERRDAQASLVPASRSGGIHGVSALKVAAPEASPAPAPPKRAAKKTPARRHVPRPDVDVDDPWEAFDLPSTTVQRPRTGTLETLLSGASRPVTLYLPQRVADGVKGAQRALRTPGKAPVTQSALIGYCLAYAYAHYSQWVDAVPADPRRRGAHSTGLTTEGRKVAANVTLHAQSLGDEIWWYRQSLDEEEAPSRLNVMATAVAWALSQHTEWKTDFEARLTVSPYQNG